MTERMDRLAVFSVEQLKNTFDIFVYIVTSLKGVTVSGLSEDKFKLLNANNQVIMMQVATFIKLVEPVKIQSNSVSLHFYDFVTASQIVRSIMEAFANQNILIFNEISEDEYNFRHFFSTWRAQKNRLEIAKILGLDDKYTSFLKAEVAEYQTRVKQTNKYKTLSDDENENTRFQSELWQFKYTPFSPSKDIANSGFGVKIARFYYNYLSDYTHGGHIRTQQILSAGLNDQQKHIHTRFSPVMAVLVLLIKKLELYIPSDRVYVYKAHEKKLFSKILELLTSLDK